MSGQIQPGIPGAMGPIPPISSEQVIVPGEDNHVNWDSLSPSEKTLVLQYLLTAQAPILAPPQNATSIESVSTALIGSSVDKSRQDIIIEMLDGWLENIKLNAELSKKADEKRVIDAMNIGYQTHRHLADLKTDTGFPLFAVGMIIGGAGIMQAMLPNPTIGAVQFNPIVDMSNQLIAPIFPDMRAELGLIGAFYAAGIQYFTVAEMATKTPNKLSDLDFAKSYASNMINLIGSASFNNYVTALVTACLAKGEPLSQQVLQDHAALVKLVLLSSSLAMLYIAEAGKMTSQEFGGMLSGNISFEKGDLRSTLVQMIKANLGQMSPKLREQVLGSLLEYFDGDPSLEALSNPAKVFSSLSKAVHQADLAG